MKLKDYIKELVRELPINVKSVELEIPLSPNLEVVTQNMCSAVITFTIQLSRKGEEGYNQALTDLKTTIERKK